MNIVQSKALFQHKGEDVFLFTLKNKAGVEVCISNLGAIIQSFKVPDRTGNLIDIVLGFDSMEHYLSSEYLNTKSYLGAIVGRYANRVGNACFKIDGETFQLTSNMIPHQIHGGFEGFDSKVWHIENPDQLSVGKLKMSCLSRDSEEGYPGNLKVSIIFSLNDANELMIETEAVTDKPTAINLTHHDYFNLHGSGRIEDHWVQIPSAFYLGQYPDNLANGEILPVNGTKYDFKSSKQIKEDWDPVSGYDQSFVLDKEYGAYGKAASAYSEKSGIKLDVFTDEPTVHFYTGMHLGNTNARNGQSYKPFSGFCFETQHHCNAVNIPEFPSTILWPGQVYSHKTSYCVSCQ
jgi:aldose 1-epimerase